MDLLQSLSTHSKIETREAQESDTLDGVLPHAVAVPHDEGAARELVTWCGQNNWAFIARGGGTKLHVGAKPSRCDLIISTEKLDHVFDYDEGNATIEAGAGIALDALEQFVGAHNQFVPLDWKENTGASLGGVVASNHFGATKMRYAMPRDMTVGLHAILSDGRHVKAGSKVVKNVSGYDLNKLFIGSFGTLGLITRVTIRLRPRESSRCCWVSTPASWQDAELLAHEILDGAFEPAILRVVAESNTLKILVRFDGSQAAVAAQLNRLPASGDEGNSDAAHDEYSPCALQLRATLPLARAASLAQSAEQCGASRVLWDCGVGVVRAQFNELPDDAVFLVQTLREQAQKNAGFLMVERAPHELKTPDFVWGTPRGDFRLQRGLKQKFDAANVCAPGRFIGGL